MTEKRFTISKTWGKSLNRLVGVICDNNKDMYITDVVNLLNDLSDENEQLKSENQRVSEQKHIYKQDWKHLCIDKELLDSENEELKSRVDDLKELNKIYVDFIVNEGYELADVMGKCDVE